MGYIRTIPWFFQPSHSIYSRMAVPLFGWTIKGLIAFLVGLPNTGMLYKVTKKPNVDAPGAFGHKVDPPQLNYLP